MLDTIYTRIRWYLHCHQILPSCVYVAITHAVISKGHEFTDFAITWNFFKLYFIRIYSIGWIQVKTPMWVSLREFKFDRRWEIVVDNYLNWNHLSFYSLYWIQLLIVIVNLTNHRICQIENPINIWKTTRILFKLPSTKYKTFIISNYWQDLNYMA